MHKVDVKNHIIHFQLYSDLGEWLYKVVSNAYEDFFTISD